MPNLWLPCVRKTTGALHCDLNKTQLAYNSKRKRNEWTLYWSSGRSERTNSGICHCVEELQEDAIKEQWRCNPTEHECTGQKQILLSKFSGLGMSHGFNDLIRIMLFQKVIEWAWLSWSTGWIHVRRRNVCHEGACGCWHKSTEGTIYRTQVLYWVATGCGEEC